MSAVLGDKPQDQKARDRILTDLGTNMLVEAGAGSGKTTSLVGRMVQHVRTGTPVERIAAVTFTRKAANELLERFRNALEKELQGSASDAALHTRFAQALHDIDRAFLGTIHSFCGRILREHPLEAGLDPTFQEVSGEDMTLLERTFWRRWVDRAVRQGNENVAAAQAVGIDPMLLFEGFIKVRTYPDVTFDAPDRPMPVFGTPRRAIELLLDEAMQIMPASQPEDGWDDLMQLVRRLSADRRRLDWNDPVSFFLSVESMRAGSCKLVQKRWSGDKSIKEVAKGLSEAFAVLIDGELATCVREWREYRYPIVMRVLQQAASDFERERHATGQLGFEDLLMLTARLLREQPAVREELGARYAHLLVDEFQDTDPVQAEVCMLLTSPPSEGNDWRTVTPRPGSLFVVGDPKQSIYRFRRADIGMYEFVKGRIGGSNVLELTSNFRSTNKIAAVVNAHFADAFGSVATAEQAAYSTMSTVKQLDGSRVSYYRFTLDRGDANKNRRVTTDAELVSSLIAERVAAGASPGEFLVLTRGKEPVAFYARALAAQNVPATTTGASLPQEHELRELVIVLQAIADPENGVLVAAALEGLFFGMSPADLWDAKQAGLHFSIAHRPSETGHKVGAALTQLYDWWIVSQRQPVDVLLERILDDTGLLFHATSQPLGDARAGALLHIVESLRSASTTGANSVGSAIERLEALLSESLDDISLRPGRSDAVRIMNVHQAKGLESPIVILAAPVDRFEHKPVAHIQRNGNGEATGGLCLGYKGTSTFVILAMPVGWDAMQDAETLFEKAEETRLLYVAATRAERELVVSQFEEVQQKKNKPDNSVWRPLAPALAELGTLLDIVPRAPSVRRAVEREAASIVGAVDAARASVKHAERRGVTVTTVTESAKGGEDLVPFPLRSGEQGKGKAWGRAVHAVIEAYLRGRRDAQLAAFALAVSNDERLAPTLGAELQAFALALHANVLLGGIEPGTLVLPELPVMQCVATGTTCQITEGVIDAVIRRNGTWEVVDWKTDTATGAEWETRRQKYERQVSGYAGILTALSGEPATARIERV